MQGKAPGRESVESCQGPYMLGVCAREHRTSQLCNKEIGDRLTGQRTSGALPQLYDIRRDPPRFIFCEQLGCRCHRKRTEKDCKGKRDLPHREQYLKSSTLTSTDQGGGERRPISGIIAIGCRST